MYWWNVGKLAEDLREGRVDEKERFRYYLATFIACGIAAQLLIYLGGPFDVDRVISAAVNLTMAIICIILCYKTNKSGDDSDFIPRMICLGWPVGIRCLVMFSSILFFMLAFFIFLGEWGSGSLLFAIADRLRKILIAFFAGEAAILFILPYYLMVLGHVASVAQAKRDQSESEMMMATALSPIEIAFGLVFVIGLLYIFMSAQYHIPRVIGQNSLATLLVFLAVGLWASLFYSAFVWRRRRSRKHTSEKG